MSIKIYQGNCLDTLQKIESQSINTCITSPPYWGLRDYGTAEWEGGDKSCDHVANPNATKKMGNKEFNENRPSRENTKTKGYYEKQCPKCGAVRKDNQLGLEETPEEFVNNLVEVFREVKRVLRDDGTVWLNLGDSYSSGGRTTTTNQSLRGDKNYGVTRPKPSKGIKPKDLIGIPWRVAFALQADGWYLRQDIIWHKPNPMPESVKDRCTKAHEYIFLLSKSVKYYFDNEAIKEDSVYAPGKTHEVEREKGYYKGKWSNPEKGSRHDGSFKAIREKRNKRSVWTVNTKPFKGAHFATFPPDLIEPCVLAGCPEGGTVLDPFGGSGTTALLANGHNRNAILCELNEEYIEIAKERLAPDGDLFTDIEVII
jgi:DNA modification methylase